MKKVFVSVALLAFMTSGVSFAAGTYTESVVNKYTSGIAKKEQQLRDNAAARQKANDAKKAEFQKKIEADKAAREAKQAEFNKKLEADKAAREAKQAETNKKIQEKKDAWNTLMGK